MDAAATREVTIDAPVEDVWSALVDDEVRAGWLGEDGAERPLRLDEAIAPERITWTWWPAGRQPDGESDGLASTVTITLRPHDDGTTRLRVVERLVPSAVARTRTGAAPGTVGTGALGLPVATAALWAERLLALELWLLLAPAQV